MKKYSVEISNGIKGTIEAKTPKKAIIELLKKKKICNMSEKDIISEKEASLYVNRPLAKVSLLGGTRESVTMFNLSNF